MGEKGGALNLGIADWVGRWLLQWIGPILGWCTIDGILLLE